MTKITNDRGNHGFGCRHFRTFDRHRGRWPPGGCDRGHGQRRAGRGRPVRHPAGRVRAERAAGGRAPPGPGPDRAGAGGRAAADDRAALAGPVPDRRRAGGQLARRRPVPRRRGRRDQLRRTGRPADQRAGGDAGRCRHDQADPVLPRSHAGRADPAAPEAELRRRPGPPEVPGRRADRRRARRHREPSGRDDGRRRRGAIPAQAGHGCGRRRWRRGARGEEHPLGLVTGPAVPPPPSPLAPPRAPEPISLREAARRLGVHYMTAYRYVRTGRLTARRDGQEWLIDPADLDLVRPPGPAGPGPHVRPAPFDRVPLLRARMVAGDEAGAWLIVDEALAAGMEPAGIHLDLLVPVLRSVGDGWAEGTISVAAEHRASAVAQRIVGRLGPQFARRGRKRGTVIIGGPAGDQHSLPGAIVADLLRGQGFDVIDLGANTPAESFAETAAGADRLVTVVLGVTGPGLDDAARSAVAALRQAGVTVPVLAGGGAGTRAGHAGGLGGGRRGR